MKNLLWQASRGEEQGKYEVRLLEKENATKGKHKSTHNYDGSDHMQTDFTIKI
jgi:hypothetical protein